MIVKLIEHGSPEYEQMLELRVTTLLEPIGVPAHYIDREHEKTDFLIGAFENGDMIGCCVLTPRNDGIVQLRQMAVRTDYQRRKMGVAIIAFAERLAKDKGFSTLMMHARDAVIGFYEKCGYRIVGEPFFEVGVGHYKMQKELV
jgi:N-acetylglutamate synthase-like GNAT family acetyltransferase